VVVTVRDDRDELALLLDALERQTRPPDELVVVDAGSTDGTLELLARREASGTLPLTVIEAPGIGISAGRNLGIARAAHERIACTDAGCRPVPGWLEAMGAALEDADFVAGVYRVIGETDFERCLAIALYPSPEEIGDRRPHVRISHRLFGRAFEPAAATGRSMAFTRAAWAAAGGFPEHLRWGEDTWFSRTMVATVDRARLAPGAEVGWRPRPSWGANARMYASYARGDAQAGRIRRYLVRALAWSAGPLVWLGGPRALRAAVACGGVAYLGLPFERARRERLPLSAWWRIPLVVAMKDLSGCAGAIRGLRERVDR
jgi:glycosyltransferase involved in cell wall biosynthesis